MDTTELKPVSLNLTEFDKLSDAKKKEILDKAKIRIGKANYTHITLHLPDPPSDWKGTIDEWVDEYLGRLYGDHYNRDTTT